MKKLLTLLLAVILLCGFGVGGTAQMDVAETQEEAFEAEELVPQATQEELEAEGRALFVQAMEDLRGDYTIECKPWLTYPSSITYVIAHQNGEYAISRYNGYDLGYDLILK